MREMYERLGWVIYWLGCAAAWIILVAGVVLQISEGNDGTGKYILIVAMVLAFFAWLIGRAARFVMAGD